jgi:hypothetical protein
MSSLTASTLVALLSTSRNLKDESKIIIRDKMKVPTGNGHGKGGHGGHAKGGHLGP